MKAPSACTLSTADQPERIELWASILASATSRRRVDEGLEFTFPPDGAFIGRLSEAIASELVCCSFFVFSVTFDATQTVMVVRAPSLGAEGGG
ncbi:hypothetical protein BH92_07675 [Rhodococcoides fascians A21d2]|uniref:hypothetical protein n=1 Tax=Nocardiaceae TaxID=85025 RepID=UPI00055A8DCE|nr:MULTISPECIES: hypothetical protein [Rhodococcus]OZF55840.1 hypothetical protein CH293_05805 [Rhodococcus sp. 14-2470-1b]QIH99759.1 hypothetical protein BH92_07675 [Rhodococcus fascians A21d2]